MSQVAGSRLVAHERRRDIDLLGTTVRRAGGRDNRAGATSGLVPKDLPPELVALVRKLDEDDCLFPRGSWQDNVDLLGGRVRR